MAADRYVMAERGPDYARLIDTIGDARPDQRQAALHVVDLLQAPIRVSNDRITEVVLLLEAAVRLGRVSAYSYDDRVVGADSGIAIAERAGLLRAAGGKVRRIEVE